MHRTTVAGASAPSGRRESAVGDYAKATAASEMAHVGATEFRALTLEALIASKRAVLRKRDVEHLIELEAILALRKLDGRR